MNEQSIKIFQAENGEIELTVNLQEQTVWLSQAQMALLFDRDRSVITKHIRNVFKDGELDKKAVCAKFAHTAEDNKTYNIQNFNLDVVISVGYRVKSQRGVQFRQWATKVLRQHLVDGYSLNQRRLQERGIEFEQVLGLLTKTLKNQELLSEQGDAVLDVINDYAKSWSLLQAYDEDVLPENKHKQLGLKALGYEHVLSAVEALKMTLMAKQEASELFGLMRGPGLESALGTIEQSFADEYLYPNVANRAANLLYMVIKNHPFVDGNKRTGAFLFLWYLRLNQAAVAKPVSQLFNDNTLVAVALLVAESLPENKALMIRLIEHFIPLSISSQ
ncbi:MAG: virulence protein RhuM/Fic/DOC family protein [Pseudomonadales bacterium]|nr:virulence protein RhuM/Fic/DOC family protein [Pseudomonadales bacterium]